MTQTRPWWEHRAVLALVILLSGVPLWLPEVPPLTDLPGHMGRYAVQLGAGTASPLSQWYDFDWHWIGNLGVDLVVQMLGPWLGVEAATKSTVIAIPMLTAAGFLATAWEIHGRIPPTAFIALPLAYNYAFNWGFVNFALSMALAFLAFALWIRMERAQAVRARRVAFVLLSLVLWTTHIFGWAILCVFAFSAELLRQWDAGRRWIALPGFAAVNCLPLLPPLVPMALTFGDGGAGGQPFGHTWFNWTLKQRWLTSILRDRWEWLDKAGVGVLSLILIAAILAWLLRRQRPAGLPLVIAAAFMSVLFLVMPFALLGSAYADMRLVPFALATALLAISTPRRMSSLAAVCALAFFGIRTTVNAGSLQAYDASYRAELAALKRVPKGSRVLGLVGKPCGTTWAVHRLDHLPSLAIVRRQAFSNDQWQASGAQLLTVKYTAAGNFASDPSQFVIEARCERRERMAFSRAIAIFPRSAFDYVWVIQQPQEGMDDRGLARVWKSGRSALYRITTE